MYGPQQPYGPPAGPPPPPRTGMSNGLKLALWIGGALVVLLVAMFIVGTIAGPPPEEKAAIKAAPTSTAASPAPAQTSAPQPAATSKPPAPSPKPTSPKPVAAPRTVPTPTAAQQQAYLAALAKIDPGLRVKPTRVIGRARNICQRILQPPSGNLTLEQYTVLELSGGNATIDEAQARQVIKAVRAWCR